MIAFTFSVVIFLIWKKVSTTTETSMGREVWK